MTPGGVEGCTIRVGPRITARIASPTPWPNCSVPRAAPIPIGGRRSSSTGFGRAIGTQWLDTTLLAPVPHRQVVLTIPKRLRACCLYRRRLLGEIARVAARTVTAAIRTLTGDRDLAVGIVACLQTHGSRANWHPHVHLLVTDGGFRPDGTFVSWSAQDTARLTEAFRRAVLRLFVRPDLFDEEQAAGMLAWPHSGFHVHTAVWVPEDDRAFATRLARYCARNPVAVLEMYYDRPFQRPARGGEFGFALQPWW